MDLLIENKSKLSLLTVVEVASILKMNAQVVSRKLSAGQLRGYKLGKDWRVSEQDLIAYLEAHANDQGQDRGEDAKVIRSFFRGEKLKEIPATRKKRLVILRHLVNKLDMGRVYPERELNEFLAGFHGDVCTLRREMVMNRLMVRKDGNYKVVTWNL